MPRRKKSDQPNLRIVKVEEVIEDDESAVVDAEPVAQVSEEVAENATPDPIAARQQRQGPTPEELESWIAVQRGRVEAILKRFTDHNWQINYATHVMPISADFLLRALVNEGRLDRAEMTYRQLVIQENLLQMEFKNRTVRSDEEALSGKEPKPSGLIVPIHARQSTRSRTSLN